MPEGVLVTVPVPAPTVVTVRTKLGVNVAVTAVAAVRVTVHVPVPVHAPPLQPVKADPAAGVAVSVTTVPSSKVDEQTPGQPMPGGLLVTVPEPVPAVDTIICGLVEPAIAAAAATLMPSMSAPMSRPSVPAPWKGLEAESLKFPPTASA